MGSRVLLADDSVTIQKVVGIIFANEDYELTVVGSGDAALQKAREIMPDVMLIDALMPGKNGYEVCGEIRRDPRLSHISLLLMTGAFEVVDEEKSRQSGADDFITKPFESQTLIDSVARLIALSRERASKAADAAAVAPPPVPPAPQPVPVAPVAGAAPVAPAPVAPAPLPQAAVPVDDIWGDGFDAGFAEEAPASQPQAVPVAAASDDDLWGVFDMDAVEPQPAPAVSAAPAASAVLSAADDFFSFDEEPVPAAVEPAVVPGAATGFEPFGEQEFSLGDSAPVDVAPAPMEDDFSTISFDEPEPAPQPQPVAPLQMNIAPQEPPVQVAAAFAAAAPEPVPPVAPAVAPQPAPDQAAIPAALDEEQLKMLLSKVSRDVIEKIVWEVVPDLAEAIIREEIRKIKEGIGR